MNNGANEINQIIPGVKVAPPSEKPVDATTSDVGAAVSKAQPANTQPTVVNPQIVAASTSVQPISATTVSPANVTANQPVTQTINATPVIVENVNESGTVQSANTNGLDVNDKKKKVKKPKNKLARFFFFLIILLIGGMAYLWKYHEQQMVLMDIKCTPVSTTEGSKELDLDSTIVKDLYGKVQTTIREDLENTELNDQMKVYLAYRQIATGDMYESHCNKFDSQGMEPFKCEVSASFVPKAFKEETLQIEIKKLFGDDTDIPNQNVQLGKGCVGGFQYIEERGEYVQGKCSSDKATMYSADKELISAVSTESTIVLTERVKYYGNEGLKLTNKLVSGNYKYTFKLDMNYNYILISKELVE